jgi:parallel beta-helix repeat protein
MKISSIMMLIFLFLNIIIPIPISNNIAHEQPGRSNYPEPKIYIKNDFVELEKQNSLATSNIIMTRGSIKKHGIISIQNETDFINQATLEGWSGLGTHNDPFIIENLEIDANGTGFCIYINNIIKINFIIRNCILYNATADVTWNKLMAGIVLNNIRNNAMGKIIKNSGFNNTKGILLRNCSYIIINKNNFTDNGVGILLENSSYVLIRNNDCDNNVWGIFIEEGINNELENNSCSYNIEFGIYDESGCSLINNNSCNFNSILGLYSEGASIITNNECISNKWGIWVESGYYVNISNNHCRLNKWGIWVILHGHSNIISNNNCTLNHIGISVNGGYINNTISNNICNLNQEFGIAIGGFFSYPYPGYQPNKCILNTCIGNRVGIFGDFISYTKMENNFLKNIFKSISLNYSRNNTIINNTSICDNYGISLSNSSNDNLIYNNYFKSKINYKDKTCHRNIWNISKTLGRNIVNGPYLGGNYWSNYKGVDKNNDALGDTKLPHSPGDHRPLIPVNLDDISGQFIIRDVTTKYPTTGDNHTIYANVVNVKYVRSVHLNYWFDNETKRNITMDLASGDIANGTYTTTISVPNSSFNLFYIINASNQMDQWKSSKIKVTNILDNDPPEIIDLTNMKPTTGDNCTFKFQITDNINVNSAFIEYWFDGNNQSLKNISLQSAGTTFYFKIEIPFVAKNISYLVSAMDNSSNCGTSDLLFVQIDDNDAPIIIDQSEVPVTGKECQFMFSFKENIGLYKQYFEYWFDNDIHTNISIRNDFSYNIEVPENASKYYGIVTAIDSSYNQAQLIIEKPVVDNIPPFILDLTYIKPKTGKLFSMICSANDNIMVKKVTVSYSFDNGEIMNDQLLLFDSKYSVMIKIPEISFSLHYSIIAKDSSGNIQQINNTFDVLDVLPPEISDHTLGIPTTGDRFEIIASAEDNIRVEKILLEYWFDNKKHSVVDIIGKYSIYTPDIFKRLKYILTAIDGEENTATITRNLSIVDNDKPEINDLSSMYNNIFTFGAKVTDNIQVIDVEASYRFDNSEYIRIKLDYANNVYKNTVQIPNGTKAFYYSIRAIDSSVNINTTEEQRIELIEPDEPKHTPKQDESYLNLWILLIATVLIILSIVGLIIFNQFIKHNKRNNRSTIEEVTKDSVPTTEVHPEPVQEPNEPSANMRLDPENHDQGR